MTYYSTGKSPYLKEVGVAVETDEATAQILIKKGFITEKFEDSEIAVVEEVETAVEDPVEKPVVVKKPVVKKVVKRKRK